MRAVLQRVDQAEVAVDGEIVGAIGRGLVVLVGVAHADGLQEVSWMTEKIAGLRIFEDGDGKMNLSIEQIGGEVLVVSQFTLYGDCRRGRRPSFTDAAAPEQAEQLYLSFAGALRSRGLGVATGSFGASMSVRLVNNGPVTLILDSPGV
jgi:D-aminoacyl-tRNA deacylase